MAAEMTEQVCTYDAVKENNKVKHNNHRFNPVSFQIQILWALNYGLK